MSNPIERAIVRLASSKAGAWYFVNVTSRVDPWLLRRSGGRLHMLPGMPVLLLEHTGAKTGVPRETPLAYAREGDTIILIASMGGAPRNPAWYHNLKAHPEVSVIASGRSGRYLARETEGAERERLWAIATDLYPGYETYQRRAARRTIPVMALERVPAAGD